MKVAILGGTGFVGNYLVDALLNHGHTPRLLVRDESTHKLPRSESCEWIVGDIDDDTGLRQLITDVDAVVYNIGILREFPAQGITFDKLQYNGVVRSADIAVEMGVKRFLHMSANGVDLAVTAYQRTKAAAEAYLKTLDLDWTIFRPSVIFGNPRDRVEFASMLKQQIIDSPLPAPLFYDGLLPYNAGSFKLSPVHVENVTDAMVATLDRNETYGKTYTLGGPRDLSWKEILSIIAEAVGKSKWMLPVPALAPSLAASLFDRFSWFPISQDQIRMLLVGNQCSGEELFSLCDIAPIPFDTASLDYLGQK